MPKSLIQKKNGSGKELDIKFELAKFRTLTMDLVRIRNLKQNILIEFKF